MGLETLIAASSIWLFGKYHSKFVDGFLNFLKESGLNSSDVAKWAKYGWTFAPIKYDNKVRELHGQISLLGKPNPVSLEGIFTDVYVLNELTAFRRFDIRRLKEISQEPESLGAEVRRTSGLELVKDAKSNRLFILGRPGAGKTTFLKYLALQATKGVLDKIPIFVSLKEWDDSGLDLFPFLVKQLEICDFPNADLFVRYVLKRGYAIVLFDGLDEVNEKAGKREKTIAALRDFSNQYWEAQCIITCRIAATDYSFEHFQYLELADFTEEQINQYTSKWFTGEPQKLELFREEFNKSENKGLRELGRQPILLALLCIYFDETLVFAHRRVEIYEKSLEALLIKWDASRLIRRAEIYRGLSLGRKQEMFARIAARSFQDNEYFLRRDKLTQYIVDYLWQLPNAEAAIDIDGDAVLKAIEAQHGLFSERAEGIYSFSHLTFQEYFTAKFIVSDSSSRALRNLLSQEIIVNTRWNEVIRFTASLLGNADMFFEVFHNSVNDYIRDDQLLVNFIDWAQVKARSVEAEDNIYVVRAVYCLLAISISRTLLLDRTLGNAGTDPDIWKSPQDRGGKVVAGAASIELPKTPTFILNLKQSSGYQALLSFISENSQSNTPLNHALHALRNSILDLDEYSIEDESNRYSSLHISLRPLFAYLNAFIQVPVVKYDYALDISLCYLLQLALLFKRLHSSHVLNSTVPYLKAYILKIYAASKSMRQNQLTVALAELASLCDQEGEGRWIELVNKLLEAMQETRYLGHIWEFDSKQDQMLSAYIKSSSLLNECLRQAVVSDRKSIESGILLSPTPNQPFDLNTR